MRVSLLSVCALLAAALLSPATSLGVEGRAGVLRLREQFQAPSFNASEGGEAPYGQ
jgi:hypothetical protein